MAQVRAELGADALILATRRLGDGVEITAALETDDLAPPLLPTLAPAGSARFVALDFHGVHSSLRAALQHGELETPEPNAMPLGTLPFGKAPLMLVGPPG